MEKSRKIVRINNGLGNLHSGTMGARIVSDACALWFKATDMAFWKGVKLRFMGDGDDSRFRPTLVSSNKISMEVILAHAEK